MSNRVSRQASRSVFTLVSVISIAAALSGCSTLGSAFGDPIVTGSASTNTSANMNQSMPQVLYAQASSTGKYLPPANIGRRGAVNNTPFATAAIPPSTGQGGAVITQDLPALIASPTLGSTQTMPAQTIATPIPVAQKPASIQASTAPKLTLVAKNSYTHIIESGESLYTIARKYQVTTDAVVLANGLPSPDKIFVGQKIVIPGRPDDLEKKKQAAIVAEANAKTVTIQAPRRTLPRKLETPSVQVAKAETARVVPATPASQPQVSNAKFRWPLSGKVISNFSASDSTGINIGAVEGAAIRAAGSGSVIYVGSAVEGYGNLILIKHDSGYVSAYAHLSQITVAKGDAVMRGDAIGLVGMTGSVSTPQLHFELRKGATPVDPMPLLAS